MLVIGAMRVQKGRQTAMFPNSASFCISLKSSPRKPTFAAAAAAHSVTFEFFDAISPADLMQGVTIEGCRIDITDLRWTYHEQLDPRRQQAPLTFAEIGCAYSHMRCWQIAKAMDLDHGFVFEDDAIICQSLDRIVLPNTTDMLYLGDRVPHNWRGEISGIGCGTEGYALSRAGVLKCLEIFRVLYMPIDLQIMAHQSHYIRSSTRISDYRRDIDSQCYLNARVATRPYCRHPKHNESQMYPSDQQRAVAERDRLRLELEALRRSTSWRLTAPARAIMTAFAWTARDAARF
jgi:GR25 family glycosyltransferase involved in LPS biosynthesis